MRQKFCSILFLTSDFTEDLRPVVEAHSMSICLCGHGSPDWRWTSTESPAYSDGTGSALWYLHHQERLDPHGNPSVHS